eukprot:scaffold10493_cov93-Cylindrotheca_fusiformis.AAC.4
MSGIVRSRFCRTFAKSSGGTFVMGTNYPMTRKQSAPSLSTMRNSAILLLAAATASSLPWLSNALEGSISSSSSSMDFEEDRDLQVSHDDPFDYFSLYTDEEDWARCNVQYEENCFPTVSIEEAACRAELIVWGRVIDENSAGDRKISVNWRSYKFDEPRKTVPKWGAGLDNSEYANTTFSNDSGEFHTWVSGFSDSDNCGTRPPIDGSEAYYFLESLPENKNIDPQSIVIEEFQKDLNINFQLVTTAFGSGTATLEDYKYIKNFRFGSGDCDRIGCCFRPDCADCAQYDVKDCEFSSVLPEDGSIRASISTSAAVVVLAFTLLAAMGM